MKLCMEWRFWLAMLMVAGSLALLGGIAASVLIKPPPEYFRASYFEFALPPGWETDREGSEVICSPTGEDSKSAIIILAAKRRHAADSLDDYLAHLSKSKILVIQGGKEMESTVIHSKKIRIGNYQWADALHLNSEVPGYYTRYLATTTAHLGMVVTFSVSKDSYGKLSPEFEKSIRSLTIYQQPSAF